MFLNPWLLLGMTAVGVPIIIHLLNRRKYERVVWAALRLLRAAMQKNQRRMRIEDLLLLLLRCLIILLLALALARPILRTASGLLARGKVTAVILVDNSLSMGATEGAKTRLDLAKQAADEIIDSLPNGSAAAVFAVSDLAREVLPQPTSDLGLVRQMIHQIALTDRSSNLLPPLQAAVQTLSTVAGGNKQVYLITDGQATAWKQGAAIRHLLEENKQELAGGVQIVMVGPPDALGSDTNGGRNLVLTRLRLTSELPTINKVLRLEAEVTNFGSAEVRDVPVQLYLDDVAADEVRIDSIAPRQARSIALNARLQTEGYHLLTARMPPDRLAAAAARTIVIRGLKQVQVLLVDGDPGLEGRESETFFLRGALVPVEPKLQDQYFVQTKTLPVGELERTKLDGYDVVFLCNVGELSRTALAAVERFLNDGRGVVIFPGPNTNLNYFNDVLYRQRGILPATLGEPVGTSGQTEKFETLQGVGAGGGRFEHPITALWNESGFGNPESAHFYRHFPLLEPVHSGPKAGRGAGVNGAGGGGGEGQSGGTAVLLRYADGKPAVMEHGWGSGGGEGGGRVVLFSSTGNTRWNDLPVQAPVFVPLLERILDALLKRQDEHLNVPVGQKFVLRCGQEQLGKEAQIFRPALAGVGGGKADRVKVELSGLWPTLTYDQTDWAGVYRIDLPGGGAGAGALRVAAQVDPRECDLATLSPEDQASLAAVAGVTWWRPGVALVKSAAAPATGTEIWRFLALIVVVLAGVEMVLAFWFSRSK